jgi:hypothetical protein
MPFAPASSGTHRAASVNRTGTSRQLHQLTSRDRTDRRRDRTDESQMIATSVGAIL